MELKELYLLLQCRANYFISKHAYFSHVYLSEDLCHCPAQSAAACLVQIWLKC